MTTTTRRYRRTEPGQIVLHRLIPGIGATVTVERQRSTWVTTCQNHGQVSVQDTRKEATRVAAEPDIFCGDCARIFAGKAPAITTGKIL